MKIIEAMKQCKDLLRKAGELRSKAEEHAADLDLHTPRYGTYDEQRAKVSEWLQGHESTTQEICRLKTAIQRTNLATSVTIELGDKAVTKTIAEWVYRRRELSKLDLTAWSGLIKIERSGRVQEGTIKGMDGETGREVKIRRYYDPKTRDAKMDMYASEPSVIDGRLEVTNAVTDLIE